jgi:hypothetical protein
MAFCSQRYGKRSERAESLLRIDADARAFASSFFPPGNDVSATHRAKFLQPFDARKHYGSTLRLTLQVKRLTISANNKALGSTSSAIVEAAAAE